MKNGLIQENGTWIYYKDDIPYHAGVIQHGDDIYYISSNGRVVTGQHAVHTSMANGILKRGIYTFGEDGRLIEGSYRPPEKQKKHSHRHRRHSRRKTKIHLDSNQLSVICGVIFAVAVILAIIAFSVAKNRLPLEQPSGQTEPTTAPTQAIILPVFDEEVYLCSAYAAQVYNGEADISQAFRHGDPYLPFVFEYRLGTTPGVLRLSEHEDMRDYREYTLDNNHSALSIDNLKTATTYHYRVLVGDETFSGSFRTAKSPRFLSIPSLKNVRDIGGYQTTDGKTVKQGLLIRGPEVDGLVNTEYFIPSGDIGDVQETFGFVYEMDLRTSDIYVGTYQSRFGTDVGHRFYNAPSYTGLFKPENLKNIKNVFSDLANPDNYPMYIHCTWGADRTGTVVFLLQGVLGISENDIRTEYLLTDFSTAGFSQREELDKLIWGLESYKGDTLQEKIVSYLTETVGVTQQEIDSIRTIMLEE